jgi:hypothetical protein
MIGGLFDVFLERPHDTSPEGRERLARALATRYNLDADVFRKPISSGRRVRVKANVDERTARALARELEGFGAHVSIAAHTESRPSRPVEAIPSATFTVVTVDGADPETLKPPPSFPVGSTTMPQKPKAASASTPPAPTRTKPHDVFAPPSESEQPLELQTMPAKVGTVAKEPTRAPPPPPTTAPIPLIEAAHPPPERERPVRAPMPSLSDLAVRDPRGRLAAALGLGLLLGFLPAHVYASFAEDKLDDIGAQLAREPAPQTEAEYQLALQQFDLAERRADRVKTRIVVVTGVVWLLAGVAAAFGYWRLTAQAAARPSRAGA